MADARDDDQSSHWFTVSVMEPAPSGDGAAPASIPPDLAAGEKFGYHPDSALEAAPEAFPVVPQVFEMYGRTVNEINQGIADGSINGDDKDRLIELSEKYNDRWDEFSDRSAKATDRSNDEHFDMVNRELKEFVVSHPNPEQEFNDAPGPLIKDAIDVNTDAVESSIDRAHDFTSGFLDAAQVYLDFTREVTEMRAKQDGADADALHQRLEELDALQSGIDRAHQAADEHRDTGMDVMEDWRAQSERMLRDLPHVNQTSESYSTQAQVAVTQDFSGTDDAGVHETTLDASHGHDDDHAQGSDAGHDAVVDAVAAAGSDGARDHESAVEMTSDHAVA